MQSDMSKNDDLGSVEWMKMNKKILMMKMNRLITNLQSFQTAFRFLGFYNC